MNESGLDDFEVEISDLPEIGETGRVPALLRKLATRPRLRSRLWRAAIAGCALMLIFLALNGSVFLLQQHLSSLFAHATPITTGQSGAVSSRDVTSQFNTKKVIYWNASTPPVVAGNETLGQVPQRCSQNTPTQNFASPAFTAGVGGSPIWVTGFAGPRAILNRLVRAKPPQYGWYQQLELVSETNYTGTVTLQGGIVGNTFPLWFGTFPQSEALINAISVKPLDMNVSNHFGDDQQWGILPIRVYIAEAGCYYLHATWDGGSWMVYFAAGL